MACGNAAEANVAQFFDFASSHAALLSPRLVTPHRRPPAKNPSISYSVLPLVSGSSRAATRKKTTVQPAQKKNIAA